MSLPKMSEMLTADETVTLNAANAAAKRREQRRSKILANPAERLRRIGNYKEPNTAEQESTSVEPCVLHSPLDDTPLIETKHEHTVKTDNCKVTTPFHPPFETDANTFVNTETNSSQVEEEQSREARDVLKSEKQRTILLIGFGVLIRLSFVFSFGTNWVQNITNPFVALEVSLFGYQKALGIPVKPTSAFGMLETALIFTGINKHLLDSCNATLTIIMMILMDFALYFFAFALTGLFV